MRWLVLVLALTGCRQIFGIQDPQEAFIGDGPIVTPDAKQVDAQVDAMSVAAGHCDPNDATLVACWDFEGNLKDASVDHLDATTIAGVSYHVGELGMAIDVNGADVLVAENPHLDLAAFTIEAWINPAQLPSPGTRMGIVDNNTQYGLTLLASGVRCISGTTSIDLIVPVPTGMWTHIACTSDGVNAEAWAGVNRKSGATTAIPTTGTTGVSLGSENPAGSGSHLDGLLDAVRIYSTVRSDTAICRDGLTTC